MTYLANLGSFVDELGWVGEMRRIEILPAGKIAVSGRGDIETISPEEIFAFSASVGDADIAI